MSHISSGENRTLDARVDGADDFVRISGPSEGLRLGIVFGDEALMAACRSTTETKTPRFNRGLVSFAKKPSTALSHEHEVGVKWNVKRSCRLSHRRTLGCLWAA